MLRVSKLKLSWEPEWNRYQNLYSTNKHLDITKVPRSHSVLESGPKGRDSEYTIHGHMAPSQLSSAQKKQTQTPVAVGFVDDDRLWWYQGTYYEVDADLEGDDVAALVHETENKKRLKLEKAHALMAMRKQLDEKAKRQPIPQDVKVTVGNGTWDAALSAGPSKALNTTTSSRWRWEARTRIATCSCSARRATGVRARHSDRPRRSCIGRCGAGR